jgi:release factor glutamine methyltransferase
MTVKEVLQSVLERNTLQGITLYPMHLRRLVSRITGKSPDFLFTNPTYPLSEEERRVFEHQVHQLNQGVPLSRLLGEREFWSLPFLLNKDTLDPRADSECLVEAVLKQYPDRHSPLRILDLGTGTGCLLIALLSEYLNAEGVGVDISEGALDMARLNAEKNLGSPRAQFIRSSWFEGVTGLFDIIISNPPYISSSDYETLDDNVRLYDPIRALVAEEDGLACYHDIISKSGQFLKDSGHLCLELGIHQVMPVSDILKHHGFTVISIEKDLSGVERCMVSSYDR